MAAPLGGGAEDPGAPTINAKKLRRWASRPPWGGGGGHHPEFKRCVVNCIGSIDKK
jgi:hypothetical protein